jgi:hypothetical protein
MGSGSFWHYLFNIPFAVPVAREWFFYPNVFGFVWQCVPAAIWNAAIPTQATLHSAMFCKLHSFTRKSVEQNRKKSKF